jgi:hypothetical protein
MAICGRGQLGKQGTPHHGIIVDQANLHVLIRVWSLRHAYARLSALVACVVTIHNAPLIKQQLRWCIPDLQFGCLIAGAGARMTPGCAIA